MHPQTIAFVLVFAVLTVIGELFVIARTLRRMRADLNRLLMRPWCRAAVPPNVAPLEPVPAGDDRISA